MSFYRISFPSLDRIMNSVIIDTKIPNETMLRVSNFLEQLKKDGDLDSNEIITRAEYDHFINTTAVNLDVKNKNQWLFQLINQNGEQLKAKQEDSPQMGPYFYEQIGIKGLTEDYQKKYNEVIESGLKINLKSYNSSNKVMAEIDLAYNRFLAIEESKKTGIPIVVVLDRFQDPGRAHGNQIAHRDIEKQGLIALRYDLEDSLDRSEIVKEVINLKEKGVNIQSFNYSSVQSLELTVKKLREALEKDGIVKAGEIKDDGSNLINYKSQIRNWLLNGKSGIYGPVMPGLRQLMPGLRQLRLLSFREAFLSFEKLANHSIDFVNCASNEGPGTINIYSFAKGAIPVGAIDSKGKYQDYSSETSLVKDHAVVEGYRTVIYEQGGEIRHDYDGDFIYDEKFSIYRSPQDNKYILTETEQLLKLEEVKLADKKVLADLRKSLHNFITLYRKDPSVESIDSMISSLQSLDRYVFKKEDLELIKKDLRLISKDLRLISKDFDNGFIRECIRSIDIAQSKSRTGFCHTGANYFLVEGWFDIIFAQIQVNEDNGKLQFIFRFPIDGTSFAAPQIAVQKALK